MPWNGSWPIGTQSVKSNRVTGQENTTYIKSTMEVDHYWIGAYPGKHAKVTMPNYGSTPSIDASEGQLFVKDSGSGMSLYLQNKNAIGGANLSQISSASAFPPLSASEGYTFLPGDSSAGLLLQWGIKTIASSSVTTLVTFPIAFKAATVPYNISLTIRSKQTAGMDVSVLEDATHAAPTNTEFYIHSEIPNTANPQVRYIYWSAIGVATP